MSRRRKKVAPRKPAPAARLKGNIEPIEGGSLRGWLAVPPGSSIGYRIDGQLIDRGHTGENGKATRSEFEFALAADLFDGSEHQIEVGVLGRKGAWQASIVRTLTLPLFASSASQSDGWIDGVRDGVVCGWHAAATGTKLIVFVDEQFIGATRNTIARQDVIDAGHATGPSGFEIDVPAKYRDGKEHLIEIRPVIGDKAPIRRAVLLDKVEAAAAHRKSRAAVVCWDLGHNPAGRALVLVQVLQRLYDQVDLVGPLYPRFGGKVWEPIADDPTMNVIAAPVKTFGELQAFSKQLQKQKYDFVHICKPRWPGLYLGIGLANSSDCPIALDIDDYEPSFFAGRTHPPLAPAADISSRIRKDAIQPFDYEGTMLAHTVLGAFPLITVSNVSLQAKFGGTIIRHARDERVFDPRAYDRAAIRRSYGYGPREKVVLFLGTIRRHKGVVRLAEAIAQLERKDVRLCLIGPVNEQGVEAEITALLGDNVSFHRGVPFSELAATTVLADLICLPQETESEVSQFQIPAKLTDALALDVPAIVEDLPPFKDLGDAPGLYIRKKEALSRVIGRVLSEQERKKRKHIRDYYLSEFSTSSNAERLQRAIQSSPPTDHADLERASRSIGASDAVLIAGKRRAPTVLGKRGRDVVFVWKQNDSNLFGRRSDMVAKYLLRQGFAGRIIQFDASMALDNVNRLHDRAEEKPLSADGMVYRNIVSRHLGLAHELQTSRYTIIHDAQRRSFLGRSLPPEKEIPDVIRHILKAERVSEEALLWLYPVTFDFERFLEARRFNHIVADVIDDQRSFTTNESYRRQLEENYAVVMAASSAVFANCEGVADRFRKLTKKAIHIVSNAAERIVPSQVQTIDLFAGQSGVVRIGYVGNLRDRIDLDLLHKIASADPSWRLILVGPTGGHAAVEALSRYSNVSLVGPQRYDDSVRLASSFDIAIIPHTVDELTDSMNPLKLYMYQALGLPVVSTDVANMTGAGSSVHVAKTHGEFLKSIRSVVSKLKAPREDVKRADSNPYWDEHVQNMSVILNQHYLGGNK